MIHARCRHDEWTHETARKWLSDPPSMHLSRRNVLLIPWQEVAYGMAPGEEKVRNDGVDRRSIDRECVQIRGEREGFFI